MAGIPRAVEWLGILAGWLACLLLDRFRVVAFAPPVAGSGIPNWCTIHGYAKAADWFWFAAFPLAGIAGARLASVLQGRIRRSRFPARLPDLPAWPAAIPAALAAVLLFSRAWDQSLVIPFLALAGAAWPWACRGWYGGRDPEDAPGPPRPSLPPGWIAAAVAVSCAWVADPCLRTRALDLLHEGVHLLHVQSRIAGDLGAGTVHTMYGPLYTWSICWWMDAFGTTVASMRWYFLAAQAAGMAAVLLVLRAVCGTRTAVTAGAALLLGASCTGPYGWANILRVTLPLASVMVVATTSSRRAMAAAGFLAATGLLYSHEFGLAGIAASVVALLAARRDRREALVPWALAAAATLAVLWVAMHGADSLAAAVSVLANRHPADRLGGFTAYPLPGFRWPLSDAGWSPVLRTLSIWIPVLLASATLAASARSGLSMAAAVFALLAMIPAVARPLGHQSMAAPAWILLAAFWLDALVRGRRIAASAVLAVAMLGWGLVAPDSGARNLVVRWTCKPPAGLVAVPADYRLGGVLVTPGTARFLGRAVPLIRELCPPDGRIVLAAPMHLGLAFIAGRAAAPPFPMALLAASPADRRLLLEGMERWKVPLAVVEMDALDVPLPEANPELWTHLRARWRPAQTIDNVIFFVREY